MTDRQQDRAPGAAPEDGARQRPKRAAPVFVYLLVLFIAAFLMLLLAYFIQQRNEGVASPIVSRGTSPAQVFCLPPEDAPDPPPSPFSAGR